MSKEITGKMMRLALMKMLIKLLFTMLLVAGCSLVAFGQNDDNKNPPPKKGEQPKIMIVPKNDGNKPKDSPRDENPRESTKPKKPDDEK
jgi:hypothetical protein